MRTNKLIKSLYVFLSSVLVLSCILKQPDPQGVENPTCENGLISRYTRKETGGPGYIYDNSYEYVFDTENRISQIKMTKGGSHYNGLIEINTLSYDKEGYLISRISKLENLQANSDTYDIKDEYYTYENGRLIKTIGTIKSYTKNGSRGTYPIKDGYEYNTKGSLIRQSDVYDHVWTYAYDANEKLTGYSESLSGSTSSTTYTFANGHVSTMKVKSGNDTYENRYTYDIDDQLIEDRRFRNTEPYGTNSYVYDNQKLPVIFDALQSSSTPIAFKGHPSPPPIFGTLKHNKVSQSYEGVKSQEYTLTYNGQGYPTKIISRENIDRYTGKSSGAETTIEYCK